MVHGKLSHRDGMIPRCHSNCLKGCDAETKGLGLIVTLFSKRKRIVGA